MMRSHSWVPVFWAAAACNVMAAGLALFWLKPQVARLVKREAIALAANDVDVAEEIVEAEFVVQPNMARASGTK
jgi:hypothetical protein